MEVCPNCGTQVAGSATECPTCGLPRNLPLYDADGTVIGTTFGPPGAAGVAAGPATAGTAGTAGTPASVTPMPTQASTGAPSTGRARTVMIVLGALVVALVLGVAVAVVVNVVVIAPSRSTTPDPGSTGGHSPAGSPDTSVTPPSSPASPPSSEPPPVDQAALLKTVGGSVVTVVASTCSSADFPGLATGFLIDPSTVVTAWSGVADAVAVAVTGPDGVPVPATVQQADRTAGIAVLKTTSPLDGPALQPGSGALAEGQQWYGLHTDFLRGKKAALLAIGIGGSGKGSLDGAVLQHAFQTNAAAGDFPAGGPLVDGEGRVVGLLTRYPDSDVLLAVGIDQLQRVLQSGSAPEAGDCSRPVGPQSEFAPRSGSNETLEQYFGAINSGDYSTAWSLLAEKIRGREEDAEKGWTSTYDFNVVITDVGGGKVRAEFDSIFAAGRGPEPDITCARWGIVYTIVDGTITAAKPDRGPKGYIPC